MNRVVEILMERDGISEEEARTLVRETRDELIMLDNPFEADEIIEDYLGLEPDYLEDILYI
jgi:hypothetical protein